MRGCDHYSPSARREGGGDTRAKWLFAPCHRRSFNDILHIRRSRELTGTRVQWRGTLTPPRPPISVTTLTHKTGGEGWELRRSSSYNGASDETLMPVESFADMKRKSSWPRRFALSSLHCLMAKKKQNTKTPLWELTDEAVCCKEHDTFVMFGRPIYHFFALSTENCQLAWSRFSNVGICCLLLVFMTVKRSAERGNMKTELCALIILRLKINPWSKWRQPTECNWFGKAFISQVITTFLIASGFFLRNKRAFSCANNLH